MPRLQKSDWIIVFGTPKEALQKELRNHSNVIIQHSDRDAATAGINIAKIQKMNHPVNTRKRWQDEFRSMKGMKV